MLHVDVQLTPGELRKISGALAAIADHLDRDVRHTPLVTQPLPPVESIAAFANQASPFASQVAEASPPVPPAPPPPPPPPAPPALTVFAPPAGAGIEVDSKGFPWDGRIHASSRVKVADGTWRQRRNLDDATLSQVENELRALMASRPAGSADLSAVPINTTPPAPASVGVVPIVSPSDIQPPPPPPAPVPPPPPVSGGSFLGLMRAITKAYTEKVITQDQITAAVQTAGVPSLPMLAQRTDLINSVASALGLLL